MNVWVPKKWEIESMLRDMERRFTDANNVSEVKDWMDDQLNALECHVANRADVESGKIKE